MSTSDIQRIVMALRKDNHDNAAQYAGPKVHTMNVYEFVRAVLRAIREPTEDMQRAMIDGFDFEDQFGGAPPEIMAELAFKLSLAFSSALGHLLED